jgi:hypothetical protein
MNMKRRIASGAAGLILGACLGLPAAAVAGPYVNVMQPCDCPPTHYSAFHVLTPVFYRWAAWCQGPCRYTFAPNYHPDIPPTYWITKYHCPSVNPLQFAMQNYPGLGGPNVSASYQSAQQRDQQQTAERTRSVEGGPQLSPGPKEEKKAPQLLPPPKEEKK